jgi:hypothetical protein
MTASIRPKIAVFAPIPSASVQTATVAKPGLRESDRNAYRRSRTMLSSEAISQASRDSSRASVTLPIRRRAATAASGASPSRR